MTDWPIERDPVFGCMIWLGRKDKDGYGRHKGKLAHRLVWTESQGEIPDGMEIEHICRRRDCVAIKHMALYTRSEQERSKMWRRRIRRRCAKGCDMSVTGMVTSGGGMICRRCER